jgi:hypothetical protein
MSKTITLNLPESVLQHFEQVAAATQQPMTEGRSETIEQLVMQSAINNLPPMPSVSSPELQHELSQMQQQDVSTLQQIAESVVDLQQFERHSELLELNQTGALTVEERSELTTLRQAADALMIRKAYAWSVLKWQGVPIPNMNSLPTAEAKLYGSLQSFTETIGVERQSLHFG